MRIAANTLEQLIKNIRAVFKCIWTAGLKLTIEKCHFGVTQVELLSKNIIPSGIAPQDPKVKPFLFKVQFSKSKKQVQKYTSFVNYCRNYIPRLSEELMGMYELLKADTKITLAEDFVDNFKQINASLAEACGLALRLPVAGKQYIFMLDVSLWETAIPTLVLTENRSVNRFFETKTKKHATCNMECLRLCITIQVPYHARSRLPEHCSQFSVETHPKRKSSTETTRRYTNVTTRGQSPIDRRRWRRATFLLTRLTKRIRTNFFCTKSTQETPCYRRTWKRTLNKSDWSDQNTTQLRSLHVGAIKENARFTNEQDADPLLKALNQRILHEEYTKRLFKTEPRGQKLLRLGSIWRMEYSCENTTGKTVRLPITR